MKVEVIQCNFYERLLKGGNSKAIFLPIIMLWKRGNTISLILWDY